jgi:RHS repeat-associated protein
MKDFDMLVSYRYDVESRLTIADPFSEPVSSMTWDADSNRVSFTSSEQGTTEFVYDTTAGIPAVIEEAAGGSVYYVREPSGSLIARVAGENTSYYHFDALGSTRLLTDADGAVTDEYTYDAWGTLTNHTEHTGSVDQPYQFVGWLGYYTHYQDVNLPLLLLGVRFYQPDVGRFTEPGSPYTYANNNPVSDVQPQGDKQKGTWWDWIKRLWPFAKKVAPALPKPLPDIMKQLDKLDKADERRDAAMTDINEYKTHLADPQTDSEVLYTSCYTACMGVYQYFMEMKAAAQYCEGICDYAHRKGGRPCK